MDPRRHLLSVKEPFDLRQAAAFAFGSREREPWDGAMHLAFACDAGGQAAVRIAATP